MVSEVFSCWVLDRVESAKSSIVAYVLPLPLVRFELKEVGPIFNHELVELIEFLLCALILHIVLQIFIRLQEQILLVGLEHAPFLFFASH